MTNDIEWKMVKLGDVCTMPTKTISSNTFETRFYVGTENMLQNCFGIIDNEISISTVRVREYKKDDILMSNIRPYLKKIWFSDKNAGCSTDVNIFRTNGKCFPKYLFHVLCQDDFFNYVNDNAIGTKMPRGDKRIIPNFFIPLPYQNGIPDLETQKQIAQKLGDMDSLIAAKEKLLAKKRNLKVAAMQKLLPRDTTEVKLKDCVNFVNGIAHENFVSELGEYILVNSKFISTEGRVVKYSSKQLLPIEEHSILMVMSDVPNGKAIGKCFYVPNSKFKGTLNQRICMLKVKDGIDSEFLFRLLNRNKYFLAFDDGVKQTNLRKSDVLACPIPLPEYTEQCRIASILSDMDCEIAAIEKEITKLQNLKTAMMQKMFCFGMTGGNNE